MKKLLVCMILLSAYVRPEYVQIPCQIQQPPNGQDFAKKCSKSTTFFTVVNLLRPIIATLPCA